MKILFLTENFPPERNAIATRVYERACFWIRWGHQLTVVTGVPNFPEGKVFPGYRNHWYRSEEMDGIRVVRVKTFIAPNAGVTRRICDFLSFMVTGAGAGLFQERPDVIVATSPQFFCAVAAWFVSEARRLPFVMEVSDLWPAAIAAVGAMREGWGLKLLSALELLMYRRARRIVALTAAYRPELERRHVPGDKIDVILNGVDLSRYAPRARDPELAHQLGLTGCFVAGYIGTHGMAHGLENILNAAERTANHPALRFLFVGSGALRTALIAEARRRGLSNVIFVPEQPKEEIARFWSLCDVALVHLKNTPLLSTAIPSKIFEAMGMGLPMLLAAPDGEAARILRDTKSGVTVPAGDPAALSAAVLDLEANREELARLARNALAAAPNFTRERQAREFLKSLSMAIGQDKLTPAIAGKVEPPQTSTETCSMSGPINHTRGD